MESISKARQLISKNYPRRHLMLASTLGLALAVGLLFSPDDAAYGDRLQMPPPLIVSDLSQQVNPTPDLNTEPLPFDTLPQADSLPYIDEAGEASEQSFWQELTVESGDSLSALFSKVGLSATDLHRVVNSSDDAKVLNRLFPGYQLSFYIPEPGQLQQLQVLTSPLEGYVFTRQDNLFEVEPIRRDADVVQVLKQGHIADSLFMAAQQADIPAGVIMNMADIFGGVIDFMLDPRNGDEFSILYEEQYLDGEYVGHGPIIGAQFINRGREHVAIRYENEQGESGFFNPEGESMRKAFLRNPLDVFRISSGFNPNRRHPILNTIRAHRGTDYAAPTGTPVRATADGTVTWAARNGSFGNLVVIEHDSRFETKYAHLNAYADSIKKGSRVRQGQIIGYVGATGSATGPHLHYEFLVDGVHKDPQTIVNQLPQAISLDETEMPRFLEQARDVMERFAGARLGTRLLSFAPASDYTLSFDE